MSVKLLFILMGMQFGQAYAYEVGNAPWCTVDQGGNLTCYYYTFSACQSSLNMFNVACVLNPNRN